jgi:hypothetical protein
LRRPGLGRRRARLGFDVADVFAVLGDHCDRRVDRDVVGALGNHNLGQHALIHRFNFHGRFIGLDLR